MNYYANVNMSSMQVVLLVTSINFCSAFNSSLLSVAANIEDIERRNLSE